ncbi:MAG: hypothetical protein GY941_28425 [Planctomycetes bacterium]|nr:hypothetical protein [Planctomycetota bacterium]
MLIEDIQWLRPVLIEGNGHAWVIYGYKKSTNQFMVNMGWGGNSDGWYTLDKMRSGIGQNIVKRIAPLDVVRFVGNTTSGDGSPSNPHRNIEEALQNAPDNATLIFKAGSTNTFSTYRLVIDRPLTLKGYNITIQS